MKITTSVVRKGDTHQALEAFTARLAARVQAGIEAATKVLHEESKKGVPEDLKALKETSRVRMESEGLFAVYVVGYGPQGVAWAGWSDKEQKFVIHRPYDYAVYVHQGVPGHTYTVGAPGFLDIPRQTKHDEMRQALNSRL